MISAVFVDRPRLAVVIAILLTLAGALSLMRIPVSQFPDIVPPQVTVSTTFTGASAAVVEQTVAQPLEAAVVGVDKMIYMKSNSANDGSYSLSVSFELGTNPDIDTVNVNNRVQQAIARLPTEVQRYGLTVRKKSAAILEFLQFYSEGGKQDPLFISNYVTINVLDRLTRVPGVGDATLFGRLDYSMRIWFDMDRLVALNLSPADIIAVIQSQNVQAAVGRVGARPTSDATQFQLNVQTQGRLTTPEQFGNIVIRANPDGSVLRIHDVARTELGAANSDTLSRLNGNPAVSIGIYLAPGANAVQTSARVSKALAELSVAVPGEPQGAGVLRQQFVRFVHHQRGGEDPGDRLRAGCRGGVHLPGQHPRDDHPDGGDPRQPDRHVRGAAGVGLFRQHDLPARHGAGDRRRRRRCDRGGGECRTRHGGRAGFVAEGGDQKGHGADHRAGDRDLPGAAVGVRAGGLHSRPVGHVVPAVRGDDQHLRCCCRRSLP